MGRPCEWDRLTSVGTVQDGAEEVGVADPLKMPALSAITQAESLERCFQELVATYRHSAAGRRCHGIIHNLNTPLQALSFQLDLLLHQAGEEERLLANLGETAAPLQPLAAERRRRLGQMGLEVEQLKALVQRLFYQGLHEDADWVCLDLNRLYEEELSLYQENSFFKHQVAKEIRLSGDLPPLTGRYIDLAQSFRNLVDNALEAMATVSRRVLRVVTHCSMGIRFIRIGDCGPGIPSDLLPHLGTPFVTTKGHRSPGHAGLGLFLAKRLLAPYGGSLKVESRPGETWVTILLPT